MASISQDANGRRRILFIAPDGSRKTIRLGKISQRNAEGIKGRVESLLEAVILKRPMESDLAEWVSDLDHTLAKRLAKVGLIATPEAKAAATLGPFLAEYQAKRIDVKPATREVWGHTVRNLIDFFGADRELATITEGDAEDFKLYLIGKKRGKKLDKTLASATLRKRLQVARQFFRSAMKRKLIKANPFWEVSAKAGATSERQRFISREDTDSLLAVCNPDWKLIVTLSRYGGLRCPSEVLSLRWQDIDWERGRIIVQSPKTEHHPGKGSRPIPMFPELRPILADAFDAAPEGAEYVVGGDYRHAANSPSGWRNCNLRTQFVRIIKRAGLTPWPRLFHNLRASRETELAKDHPLHTVTAWIGNTPQIAMKHYLQVTEADYQKANEGGAESGAQAAQNEAQQQHAEHRSASHKRHKPLTDKRLVPIKAMTCDKRHNAKADGEGFEPPVPFRVRRFSRPVP